MNNIHWGTATTAVLYRHPSLHRGGVIRSPDLSGRRISPQLQDGILCATLAGKTAIAGFVALVSVALAVWVRRRQGRSPEYT